VSSAGRERLDLEAVDARDAEALVPEVVREGVAGRAEADDHDVLAVVRERVGATGAQRVPSREQVVDLEAPRQREHVRQDRGLDLRDVHRLLLLEDAGLHAVVADAVAGARHHRVVDHDDRERREHTAALLEQVRLGDLLVEGAAGEADAQAVGLERAVLVVHPLGAAVLAAVVAVEAVVDLVHHVAQVGPAVGEGEAVALAAVVRADDRLRELGLRAQQRDQVLRVERAREPERHPVVVVVVVDHAQKAPAVDEVEDRAVERHRVGLLGDLRREAREVCRELRVRVRPGQDLTGPGKVLLRRDHPAARRRLAEQLLGVEQREHRLGDLALVVPVVGGAGGEGERGAGGLVEPRAVCHAERLDLRALAAGGALLHELSLELEDHALAADVSRDVAELRLDAEEPAEEVRHHRGDRHQKLGDLLRAGPMSPIMAVRHEAIPEPGVEDRACVRVEGIHQPRELRDVPEVFVAEAADARGEGAGRRREGVSVDHTVGKRGSEGDVHRRGSPPGRSRGRSITDPRRSL
jgi:hypothetical protein